MTTISDRAKKNGLRSSFGMFAQALFRFFTLSQSLNDEKRRVPVPHEGLGERLSPIALSGAGLFPFPMRG